MDGFPYLFVDRRSERSWLQTALPAGGLLLTLGSLAALYYGYTHHGHAGSWFAFLPFVFIWPSGRLWRRSSRGGDVMQIWLSDDLRTLRLSMFGTATVFRNEKLTLIREVAETLEIQTPIGQRLGIPKAVYPGNVAATQFASQWPGSGGVVRVAFSQRDGRLSFGQ